MNIDLRIERLILDGLPVEHRDGSVIKAAVETELARLLQSGGISRELQSGGAFRSVPRNSITLIPEGDPSNTGRQIAAAVYGRVGREQAKPGGKRDGSASRGAAQVKGLV